MPKKNVAPKKKSARRQVEQRHEVRWIQPTRAENEPPPALVDPDAVKARELVRFLEFAIRIIKTEAAHGTLHCVDPSLSIDTRPARAFIQRMQAEFSKVGPAVHEHDDGRFPVVSAEEIRAGHYTRLTPSQQRRWRVAVMRFLDVCVALEEVTRPDERRAPMPWEVFTAEEDDRFDLLPGGLSGSDWQILPEEALGGHIEWRVPFSLASLGTVAQRTKLLAAWREKAAGAKRSSTGLNGKWTMLHDRLRDGWGCNKSASALATEYERHGALSSPPGVSVVSG